MKVIRVVSELDFGGVEQVLANSLPILLKTKKLDISILVLGKGGQIANELRNQGIQVTVLSKNPRIPNIILLYKLWRLIKKSKPEVVHCQGGEANFHGILAASFAGVKNIIGEEIGIPNHHSYWKYVFRVVYSRAKKVIVISNAVKSAVVALGEVPSEKTVVVYNPIHPRFCINGRRDNKIKNLNEQPKQELVFVTTCRLVPIKNLERLIHAFYQLTIRSIPGNEFLLWIIGDGPELDKLEKLTSKLNLSDKVTFFGFQKSVLDFLEKSDVFVLPSLREGSSVSLAEAMACGLPSVVTEIGGSVEILGPSQTGFLVNPMDIHSIANGMAGMAALSEDERRQMGERAKAEAERFCPEIYLKSLEEVYNL